MKKTLAVLAALAVMGGAAQCFAAAAISFNNYDANHPIFYKVTGTLLDAAATVEVWGGPTGQSLTKLASGVSGDPGFFDFQTGAVPGVADNGQADFKVVATIGGDTGSVKWTQGTGAWDNAASPPAVNKGFQLDMPSFIVGGSAPVVPEPSTIALGVLGAAALLIRRRK